MGREWLWDIGAGAVVCRGGGPGLFRPIISGRVRDSMFRECLLLKGFVRVGDQDSPVCDCRVNNRLVYPLLLEGGDEPDVLVLEEVHVQSVLPHGVYEDRAEGEVMLRGYLAT